VVSIVCNGSTQADIYGTGTINGAGVFDYRIRVRDNGERSGSPPDTYQILVGPYVSGPDANPLQGGNIQIRRFS
jgi:hypothetical protein